MRKLKKGKKNGGNEKIAFGPNNNGPNRRQCPHSNEEAIKMKMKMVESVGNDHWVWEAEEASKEALEGEQNGKY
jgi:hypothetical protein